VSPQAHPRALGVGALLGLAGWVPLVLLDGEAHVTAAAVLLAAVAGVYLGFAVADGRTSSLMVESAVILVFVGLAFVAIDRDLGWLVGVGFLGHAAWDGLHHSGGGPTAVRPWYPPFCAAVDVLIAVPLLAGWGT
jgi:hypothetical protein